MTEICRKIIDHPSAWTAAGIGGKEGLHFPLSAEHINAIDTLLARSRHKAPLEAVRADWDHPAFNAMCDALRDVLLKGAGVAIVVGLSADRYSAEDMERIYWGIGVRMGTPGVQSQFGDRIGYVQVDEVNPNTRGYKSDNEQRMHSDNRELMGLMCVRRAESGGVSRLASTLAIHNEILRTRPELLPPLYEGFPIANTEMQHTTKPVTEQNIPTFSYIDGYLSGFYPGKLFYERAANILGTKVPQALSDAADYFDELSLRPDIALHFLLAPGEIAFAHNGTAVHSRSGFKNSAQHKRLLLRIWLDVEHGRPMLPEMLQRARDEDWAYKMRQEGRLVLTA